MDEIPLSDMPTMSIDVELRNELGTSKSIKLGPDTSFSRELTNATIDAEQPHDEMFRNAWTRYLLSL